MSSSKLRKISKIIKEISVVKSQKNYDISGLTISLCKFYYREPQKQFKDLPIGDYTIETSHNTQTLVINNGTILDKAESIQVCYELDLTSSKYESDFEIDINRLASSYNEAIDDLHNLWGYIRNIGMVADDTTIDLILPQLDTNEVWVKTEDGYKGVPLDDVEQSVKEIIEKYSKEKIQEINIETEQHVNNVLKPILDEYEENIEVQLDMYTNDKKGELDTHEQLKEQELNDLKEQLAKELDDLVKGAVADKGVMPNGTDWHTLTRGSYYVLDLFNSQFKNHPYQLASSDEERGIVIVTETEQGMSKVITYHSTSKRMFFTILVKSGIWSEWSVLGGGKGTVYEIIQPNHGFNFNSISLGNDGLWELADPNVGADAIAIKIDNDRFQLLISGQGIVPTSSRDDLGNPFIEDEYYFMSIDVPGGLRKEKPKQIIFQPLFHTRTVEGKLVADIQIGEVHDLTQHIVDNETIKEYGIATEKDLLNKLDKGNVSSNYDTAEKIEYQIKKLQANTIEDLIAMRFLKVGDIVEVLGYYEAGDVANHKRIIANEDDGSGVQLANGLWANIVKSDIYYSNWFGANKSGDVTDIFKKMIAYNKPLIINKREYNLSEFIFDIEGIIKEDNGIYSNKSIIRTEKLPENKPLKKLIGMFDYNGIMTRRGHQSLAYNKNEQEYILGFTDIDSEQSTLIFLDKNFSFIKKANVDLGHCNGLTYNPKTNKIIAGGYLDSTAKANQIFILNYDTLAIEKTVNIGYALLGVGYDEEKDFYCAGGRDTFTILDNNFNIIKKIIGTPNNEFQGLTTQDVELFNGNYFNYLYDGSENIHMISYDLKGKISQHYIFYDKGRYEPEGIFKLNNNTLLTTEYKGTQILFFEFDFNEISLNIKDVNIPREKIVYIDSNALYNGDGTQNKPYKSINYALLDNLGNSMLEIKCKGVFDERDYAFRHYKNISIDKWGDEKPTIIGQLIFFGNTAIINNIIISSGNKNIDRLIYAQGSNFYINGVEINQNLNSKNRGLGFYRSLATIRNSTIRNCNWIASIGEGSSIHFNKCTTENNNSRFYLEGGIVWLVLCNFDTDKDDKIYGKIFPEQVTPVQQLNTLHMGEKMKQEGVYQDYITYMDEKTVYDKKQQKEEEQRQLAYEQALKENPNLSYEEFMSVQPMTLNLVEEPQPSQALQEFMRKYL